MRLIVGRIQGWLYIDPLGLYFVMVNTSTLELCILLVNRRRHMRNVAQCAIKTQHITKESGLAQWKSNMIYLASASFLMTGTAGKEPEASNPPCISAFWPVYVCLDSYHAVCHLVHPSIFYTVCPDKG